MYVYIQVVRTLIRYESILQLYNNFLNITCAISGARSIRTLVAWEVQNYAWTESGLENIGQKQKNKLSIIFKNQKSVTKIHMTSFFWERALHMTSLPVELYKIHVIISPVSVYIYILVISCSVATHMFYLLVFIPRPVWTQCCLTLVKTRQIQSMSTEKLCQMFPWRVVRCIGKYNVFNYCYHRR